MSTFLLLSDDHTGYDVSVNISQITYYKPNETGGTRIYFVSGESVSVTQDIVHLNKFLGATTA